MVPCKIRHYDEYAEVIRSRNFVFLISLSKKDELLWKKNGNYLYTLKIFYAIIQVGLVWYRQKWRNMSNISKYKNGWFLLLFIMIGIVLGGLIAESTAGIESLSWLSYGNTFGLDSPLVINLGVLVITFALQIKITIASIIGVILAIIIYKVV